MTDQEEDRPQEEEEEEDDDDEDDSPKPLGEQQAIKAETPVKPERPKDGETK